MHPYCPAMPGMKTIENFAHIPNMGVALLSCITKIALTLPWTRILLSSARSVGILPYNLDRVHIADRWSSSSLPLVASSLMSDVLMTHR